MIKVLHVSASKEGGINTIISQIALVEKFVSRRLSFSKHRNRFLEIFNFKKLLLFKKKFNNEIKKVDIVHFHGIWGMQSIFIPINSNKKIVISPHGSFDPVSMKKSTIIKHIFFALFIRRKIKYIDAFLAATIKEKHDIERLVNNPKIKIKLVENGINFCVDKSREETPFKSNLKNKRVILSLSRLDSVKQIDQILIAFSQTLSKTCRYILVIAGDGESKIIKNLIDLSERLEISNKVLFVGNVKHKDVDKYIFNSNIFILFSKNEGFGLSVLEAYKNSTPVITTNATPFSFIGEEKIGWFIENNIDLLRKTFEEINLLDDNSLTEMGARGNQIFKEKYDIPVFKKNIFNFYTSLIN